MKNKTFFLALVSVFSVGGVASATCMNQTVYNCSGGTGEMAASFRVVLTSCAAPGGPVHKSYHGQAQASWLGGTHDSGKLPLKLQKVGNEERWTNDDKSFAVDVLGKRYVALANASMLIHARGHFRDAKSGMEASIVEQWLTCKAK